MEGHESRDAGWLSLAEETVPLRDTAEQEAEQERAERLCLIGERRRARGGRHVVLCAALVAALLFFLDGQAGAGVERNRMVRHQPLLPSLLGQTGHKK